MVAPGPALHGRAPGALHGAPRDALGRRCRPARSSSSASPARALAAARSCAARGAGCGLRHRAVRTTAGRSSRRAPGGRRARHDDGVDLLDGVATLVKSPGVPQDAPVVARRASAGVTSSASSSSAGGCAQRGRSRSPAPTARRRRPSCRPDPPRGRRCPSRSPATSAPRSSLAGTLDPAAAVVVCEASSFQLEDTEAFAPEAAVLLNLAAGPPRPPRHVRRLPRAEAADLRPPGPRRRRGRAPGLGDRGPGRRARGRFGAGRQAELADRVGPLWWRGEPLIAVDEIRLRGAAQPPERDGRRRRRARPRRRSGRRPAGAARRSPGSPTASRRSRAPTASSTSTTPRRRTSPRRSSALRSFPAASTRSSAAAARARTTRPLAAPSPSAARRVPDRRGGRALPERAAATGVPLHDCGDLERPSPRPAPPRPGEVVLLSPACASYDQYRDFEARGDHFRGRVVTERRRRGPPGRRPGDPVESAPDGHGPSSSRSSTACCSPPRSACSPAAR